MKQITMDYDLYQEDLNILRKIGYEHGISQVAEYLKSGLTFYKWKDRFVPDEWICVLEALGRDLEKENQ